MITLLFYLFVYYYVVASNTVFRNNILNIKFQFVLFLFVEIIGYK